MKRACGCAALAHARAAAHLLVRQYLRPAARRGPGLCAAAATTQHCKAARGRAHGRPPLGGPPELPRHLPLSDIRPTASASGMNSPGPFASRAGSELSEPPRRNFERAVCQRNARASGAYQVPGACRVCTRGRPGMVRCHSSSTFKLHRRPVTRPFGCSWTQAATSTAGSAATQHWPGPERATRRGRGHRSDGARPGPRPARASPDMDTQCGTLTGCFFWKALLLIRRTRHGTRPAPSIWGLPKLGRLLRCRPSRGWCAQWDHPRRRSACMVSTRQVLPAWLRALARPLAAGTSRNHAPRRAHV